MKKTALALCLTLMTSAAAWALNPSREYKQLPTKYNMVYEETTVTTPDGASLKTWYFPSTTNKTTQLVLMCHNGEGNMADYLRKVDQFCSNGYNVVTFDYRGYGKSSDFAIDNNMYLYPHFQDDVKAMIGYAAKKSNGNITIYGSGMGAGLALGIGWNTAEIKKIIADTPFLSMEDLEKRFSSWDTPMEVPLAAYEKKFEPIYSLDTAPAVLKNGYKQVLLIIGSNDILFKVDDMKTLQKKQPKNFAPLYVVTNPDRIDNFLVDKVAYSKTIAEFMKL